MEHQSAAPRLAPGAASTALDTGSGEPDSASLTASVLSRTSEINAEHRLAAGCAKEAVAHAIKCGSLLLEVKAELKHGELTQWINTNCEFAYSTAARYMTAAKANLSGVEISSLSALFPSGRTKKAEADSAEPTAAPKAGSPGQSAEFRVYEGDATLMSGAPSVSRNERPATDDDPSIDVGRGRQRRVIRASTITARLMEDIIAATECYENMASEFEAVAKLTAFPLEMAKEYAADFSKSVERLNRLQKRIANISREARE
jgi:hypothetical protein